MAETPLCAYARAKEAKILAGAGYTMTVLYKHTSSKASRAWHERRGPVPFTFVSVALIVDITGRSRSLVYEDLKALAAAGIIVEAQRVVNGVKRGGWVLPLRDDETDMSSAPGGDESEEPEDGQQRRPESARPDALAPQTADSPSAPPDSPPDRTARESVPPDNPVRSAGRESPPGRTAVSARPDKNSSFNSERNMNFNSAAAAAESSEERETRARATPPAPPVEVMTSRPKARRPVTTIDGEPAGSGLTAARELLRELGSMFAPVDDAGRVIEAQRIRANDPAALVRAERLLAVPLEGLDEEAARKARSERFTYVLDMCHRFADLCRRDKSKARWWGPDMLELQPPSGKTLSRWAMLERDVAEDQRVTGQAEVKARAAAEARAAVAPRTAPESPEEAAAREARAERQRRDIEALFGRVGAGMRYGGPASARAPGRVAETDTDQERERRRGERREAGDARAEQVDLELRRQMNAALARARQAKGEPLTTAEANSIRAKFGAKQEGARA